MEDEIKFCSNILDKVSRSFALTIPMLDDKLYKPVMITYLQDRLLDNFEDEIDEIDLGKRKYLMNRVVSIFDPDNSHPQADIEVIKNNACHIKGASLRKLTENVDIVYKAFSNLNKTTKSLSYKWMKEMNKGMKKYLNKEIRSFSNLDEYCYYVAGTVGGLLTELIITKSNISSEKEEKLLANYKDAVLFLQKVNIIRDIKQDIDNREKNFWPLEELKITEKELSDPVNKDRALKCLDNMISNVEANIEGLVEYMDNLPVCFPGYRKFFLVNNALGLATLQKMKNNSRVLYGEKEVKVAKIKFLRILMKPEKCFYKYSRDV